MQQDNSSTTYPAKNQTAEEVYDKPQYNGAPSNDPKYSRGTVKGGFPPEDYEVQYDRDGLSLQTYLEYDTPDGDRVKKTPKGIGSDGPGPSEGVNHVKAEITSPLSGKVIIRHFEDGSTHRFICEKCVHYVRSRGKSHAMDPIYFWGAGIYNYQSEKTPEGMKGYLTKEAMGRFIKFLSYDKKNNWKKQTGLPFPYEYLDHVDDKS